MLTVFYFTRRIQERFMFNKKFAMKATLSIALAAMLTFSNAIPVFSNLGSVNAYAKEAVTDILVDSAKTGIEDLGFASYLTIVLKPNVDYSKCIFKVDGISISPTKVSDNGAVLKWEVRHTNHKSLTVEYEGKTQNVLLNDRASGIGFSNEARVSPKWIWSYGTLSVFDYHLPTYDESGNQVTHPKQTFDVLSADTGAKSLIAYYVKPAVMEEAEKAPAVEIKFALKDENDKKWFNSIKAVKRMTAASSSNKGDENLIYTSEITTYNSKTNGIIKIDAGQNALRRSGINYIRIYSDYGMQVVEAEVVNAKEPKLMLTGAITDPKVNEDVKLRLSNVNQGLALQRDFFKSIVLKRPVADNSEYKEALELKQSDLILFSDILSLNGKLLTKAGNYELVLKINGYKEAKISFKVLSSGKKTNEEKPANNNSLPANNSGSGSSGYNQITASYSSSSDNSSSGAYSGGGYVSGSSASKAAAEAFSIDDEATPLKGISIDKTAVKVLKLGSLKEMKSSVTDDIEDVFGAASGLTVREVLVYLYKTDSKTNQNIAKTASKSKLTSLVKKFAIDKKIYTRKQLEDKLLNKVLKNSEVSSLVDKYLSQKLKLKSANTSKKATMKIKALSGATTKLVSVGGTSSGTADSSSGGTVNQTADFVFDYEMIVNAKLLKNIGITNANVNQLTRMFDEQVTNHKAIFTHSNQLISMDAFRTAVAAAATKNDGATYLSFDEFVKTAASEDYTKDRPYQLLVVLDNGSIGKHYFSGFSGNPDVFGPKTPDFAKAVEWNKNEAFQLDLKDADYAKALKAGYLQHSVLFNVNAGTNTDTSGISIDGTVLNISNARMLKALKNKESMFLTLVAKGYERIRVDINAKTESTPPAGNPTDTPANPSEGGATAPVENFKPVSMEYKFERSIVGDSTLSFIFDDAVNYVSKITDVNIEGQAFTRESYSYPNQGCYYIGNGQLKFNLSSAMDNSSALKVVIKSEGYTDLELEINPKAQTVKEIKPAGIVSGSTATTPSTDSGSDVPAPADKLAPPITATLKRSMLNVLQLELNSNEIDTVEYSKKITAVQMGGTELKMISFKFTNQGDCYVNDGRIWFSLNSELFNKNPLEVVIKAEGYSDLTFTISPSTTPTTPGFYG